MRANVLQEQGLVCCTCGTAAAKSADLQAHEVWDYNDEERVALLTDVRLICKPCHAVEHFGNSYLRVKEGSLPPDYLNTLAKHFCRVNAVSAAAFQSHLAEAMAIWKRRSRFRWTPDFGRFVELFPEIESGR